MIWDTLLNGIADDEIRREILGSADLLTRAVNEIVALVESKEMARNAVPPTEVISVSAVQRLHDADHRARRNATPCRESHNLPDRSKQSSCPLCQLLFQLYKKGLVVGIPNLVPCVLNGTGHRNGEDATSLLKWVLHHRNQAYKLLKSYRLRTLS